jgi:S1-C subfamily serine protease
MIDRPGAAWTTCKERPVTEQDGTQYSRPDDSEADSGAYRRPPGVEGPFAPQPQPEPYSPPPPTVSPAERATFGRPAGGGPFAPLPGERLDPQHRRPEPAPPGLAAAYGPGPQAQDGFEPAPGTRIAPRGHAPESPWWKADAARDPWRDPASPFWLGHGAIFTRGQAVQLSPEQDSEQDDPAAALESVVDEPVAAADAADSSAAPRGGRGARLGFSALLLMLLVALVAGTLGGGAGYWLAGRANGLLHRGDVSLAKTGTPANRPPGSVADIAKRVGPTVVSIAVTTDSEYAVGSGVVIDKAGYVLTNNHVVSMARDSGTILITFSDEATARARIVGLDPISDLAVLKVPTDDLTVASLGNSDSLAIGDPVIAIGSPLGLQGTVTAGIVSQLHRPVHVFGDNGDSDAYLDAIQTDAPINPGNSGGALVAADGSVVGINSAGATVDNGQGGTSLAAGIGYAIPVNYARQVATELIHTGKAVHASLGVQGRTATDGTQRGAYLVQVAPGGPAAAAKLTAGDVVVVAGSTPVQSYDQLAVIVQEHRPGDRLPLTFYRGAAKHTAVVTLGST